MSITLKPETEARLRERAGPEEADLSALVDALVMARLDWEAQEEALSGGAKKAGRKPWVDPIVEEIHREREAYAAKFNYDTGAICQDIMRQQRESGREYVTLSAKLSAVPKVSASQEHTDQKRNK